jgi:hypothetical protein
MSVFTDVEAKLVDVKNKVEGDLHTLLTHLEAVFQRVQQAPVEDIVKTAVASDIHAAAVKVEAVADTLRSDVNVADKVVNVAADAVDNAATK